MCRRELKMSKCLAGRALRVRLRQVTALIVPCSLVLAAVLCGRLQARQVRAAANTQSTPSAGERPSAPLTKKLSQEVSVEWKQAPLSAVLHDLAESGEFHVFLDRRVDPELPVSLELRHVAIETGLARLAEGEKLGLSLFGPLVYFGPPQAAARLRTLAVLRGADVARLPRNVRASWTTAAPWRWEKFSTPRELISQLASQARIELAGLDHIPHDLWPEVELPALSVADRLTLLAAEFDLTYKISEDGRSAELVPIGDAPVVERRYPAGTEPQKLAERWKARVPLAEIAVAGNQLVVRASVEDHEKLRGAQGARAPARESQPDPSLVRISRLEFKDVPLGQVIDDLARQLEMKVTMDRAAVDRAGVSLDKPISVDLNNATIDEVWRAVVDPTGLVYERQGREVKIGPTGE